MALCAWIRFAKKKFRFFLLQLKIEQFVMCREYFLHFILLYSE